MKENAKLVQFVGYTDSGEWTASVLYIENSHKPQIISHFSDADPQDKTLLRDLERTKHEANIYFDLFNKYNILKQININVGQVKSADYSVPNHILNSFNFNDV